MLAADKPLLRCERCGEPLSSGASQTGCLNCLLLDALEQSSGKPKVNAPSLAALLPPSASTHRYQHYEILTREDGTLWELGRGAMGVTYKAQDVNLRVPVALKIINPRHAQSAEARQRFLREARAAARLRHPNVASVFHFGTIAHGSNVPGGEGQQEECFYAMEFVEGETLEERLRRTGPLDVLQTLEIALQITRALMAAEKRGLVHRDLKPANVMVLAEAEALSAVGDKGQRGSQGEAWIKVIDFGLAKAVGVEGGKEADGSRTGVASRGEFVGTPQFASPEQFNGQAVDVRSDVFSLGVLLWYLLTGELPFRGCSLAEIHDRQLHRPLPLDQLTDAKVPLPLVNLLGTLLAADPAARPASAIALYEQLESCREALRTGPLPPQRTRRGGRKLGIIVVLTLGLLLAGIVFATRRQARSGPSQPEPVAKSVAVLPFENFGADQDNALFADGVQDEVLTNLAKVPDLQVLSRASVMPYRDPNRNLRAIGQALGVTYVVEGTVQRAGGKVRINAQLVDTRTNLNRWAEHYERDVTDLFAIQSDIAQAIAGQLQVVISPQVHATIKQAPTHNLQAYELYVRARLLRRDYTFYDNRTSSESAVSLLTEAIRLDPQFARAYALLAMVHGNAYNNFDATPARAALMRQAVEAVARLVPGSAEAHKTAASYAYWIERDFSRANAGLVQAIRLMPSDAQAFQILAAVELHQGLWESCLAHYRKADQLDPNNSEILTDWYRPLFLLRRYAEAWALLDRIAAAHPYDTMLLGNVQTRRSKILFFGKADARGAYDALANVPASFDKTGWTTSERIGFSYFLRDSAAMERDLAACPLAEIIDIPRDFQKAVIFWLRGDKTSYRQVALTLRPLMTAKLSAMPDDAYAWTTLAYIDIMLERYPDAIAEARRAATLEPLGPDVYEHDGFSLYGLAKVLALAGEREEAIGLVQMLAARVSVLSYGHVKLEPCFDSLRGDPRFEAVVASLAPP